MVPFGLPLQGLRHGAGGGEPRSDPVKGSERDHERGSHQSYRRSSRHSSFIRMTQGREMEGAADYTFRGPSAKRVKGSLKGALKEALSGS